MTNEEILQNVVEKANVNGAGIGQYASGDLGWADYGPRYAFDALYGSHDASPYYRQIIFSHQFAKAFWGEKFVDVETGDLCYHQIELIHQIEAWKHHLSKMVLEPEPLKYLEKFL